jgi:ubiquitin-protein ligase
MNGAGGGAGGSGAPGAACMTALQSQLRELLQAPPPGVNAGPADEDDMLTWIGTLQGQPGTPYEGGVFMLDLRFPPTYPVGWTSWHWPPGARFGARARRSLFPALGARGHAATSDAHNAASPQKNAPPRKKPTHNNHHHQPPQYDPPHVRFTTPIYHPNVNDKGEVCLSILFKTCTWDRGWSPALSVGSVLLSLLVLMAEPNTEHSLRPELAAQYDGDRPAYEAAAREHTRKHAM